MAKPFPHPQQHQASAGLRSGWSATARANQTLTSGKERFVIGNGPDLASGSGNQRQQNAVGGRAVLFFHQPFDATENQFVSRAATLESRFVELVVERSRNVERSADVVALHDASGYQIQR